MNIKKVLVFCVKLAFIVSLFVLIFRPETFWLRENLFQDITLGSILEALQETDTPTFVFWIGFAFLVKLGGIFSGILRWKLLLRGQGIFIPFWYLTKCWFMGRAIGLFLPGTLGLDGYRLVESARYTGEGIKCTSVIAVEKLIGFMALAILVFLTLPLGMRILNFNPVVLGIVLFILLCFILTAFLILLNPRMVQVVVYALPTPKAVRNQVNKLGTAITAYSGHKRILMVAIVLGLCVHLGICLMYFGTSMAIRTQNTGLLDILFASPLVIVGSIIGPTVSGAGVREVMFGYLLGTQAGAAKAVLFGHLGLWAGEVLPFVLSIPLLLLTTRPHRDELLAEAEEATAIQAAAIQAQTNIDLTDAQVAHYRNKLLNAILGGALGGLIAGAILGLSETIWMTRFISGLSDYFAFVWGPVAYGIPFAGVGLGVAAALTFLYVLFDKFPHAAVTTGLAGAGALAVGLLVFGMFRVRRDLLHDQMPTVPQMLMIAGVAAAAGLVLFAILAVLTGRLKERLVPTAIVLASAFFLLLFGGIVASATIEPEKKVIAFDPPQQASGPNIILVGIDTLRADYMPQYSDTAEAKTPALDEFTQDAINFQEAFAQASWTKPGFASIFSGLYPEGHGATAKMGQNSFLPDSVTTLAEVLEEGGYYTQAFANNPNIFSLFNFDQGFVDYVDLKPSLYFGATDSASKLTIYEILRRVYGRFSNSLVITDFYQPGETITAEGLAWIDSGAVPGEAPFLLFLHYMDPHDPYMDADTKGLGYARRDMPNPDEDMEDAFTKAYVDEIEYLDRSLGNLFAGLKERGLYDDSVILITSDHGEEFLEHDGWWHGNTLYDEQIYIPLLVKLPKGAPAGKVNPYIARQIDIAPTLIHLAGMTPPEVMEGVPLFGVDYAVANAGVDATYAEINFEGNVVQALRTLDHKVIEANPDNPRGLAPLEVYNVAQDPGEQHNLADEMSEQHAELVEKLGEVRSAVAAGAPVPDVSGEVSSDVKEQLEGLGYLN